MTDFPKYSYRERVVKAVQLVGDTLPKVVAALSKEAEDGKLESWILSWNTAKSCYDIRFRYKEDKVESVVSANDYLVESMATGKFRMMTAEDFAAEYEDYDPGAYVGGAILPE